MKAKKHVWELILGIVLTFFGMGLLAASWFAPPIGIIDYSALAGVGEVFTFAGALFGIDYHKNRVLQSLKGSEEK